MNKIISSLFFAAATAVVLVGISAADAQAKYTGQGSAEVLLSIGMPHYTVHFNANGGTGAMDDQDFEYKTAQALTANTFEREEYVFVNWATQADGSGSTFADEEELYDLVSTNGGEVTLYAQWEYSPMPIVFEHDGVCEFHGEVDGIPQPITGDDCEYAGLTYIDTGEKLYSHDNYLKDFEIGFKIVEYNYSQNVDQSTFATAKYESGSTNAGNPGFAIRKGTNGNIEITQMIGGNHKATASFPASSVTEIKLARVDEKVYYSVNGGNFVQLQSNVGTSDYHEMPMWFGAAPTNELDENGNYIPHRYLVGKLSDIYIKVGNFDIYKRTITFHANGEDATVNPEQKVLLGDSTMGTMPTPERPGHAFEGWYTAAEGGERIREDAFVTSDMDLYAHWSDDTNICEVQVGGNVVRGESLADCMTAAGSGQATITILTDVRAKVTINAGQDITFDLGDNVWSDSENGPVITNNGGKIHIVSGTITSSRTDAVINNNVVNGNRSELEITGNSKIIATGSKQAVYNDGGIVVISGNAYLSATSLNRAALHNRASGDITILGGTIESKGYAGIRNESSSHSLVIGEQGNGIGATPVIRGASNGVLAEGNFEFYDGILMGVQAAVSNRSKIIGNDGTLTDGTTEIDGTTYYTLYNE